MLTLPFGAFFVRRQAPPHVRTREFPAIKGVRGNREEGLFRRRFDGPCPEIVQTLHHDRYQLSTREKRSL